MKPEGLRRALSKFTDLEYSGMYQALLSKFSTYYRVIQNFEKELGESN